MRTDVKIGLVLSLVVVVIAGVYFVGGDKEPAVSMDDKSAGDGAAAAKDAPSKTPGAAAPKPAGSKSRTPVTKAPDRDGSERPDGKQPPARAVERTKPNPTGSAAARRTPGHRDAGRADAGRADAGRGDREHRDSPRRAHPRSGDKRLLSDIIPGTDDDDEKSTPGTRPGQTPRRRLPGATPLASVPRTPGDTTATRPPAPGAPDAGEGASDDAPGTAPGTSATGADPVRNPRDVSARSSDDRLADGRRAKMPVAGRPARTEVGFSGRRPSPRGTRLPAGARTHVIAQGDTLAILAEQYYGKQSYADYLMQVNPGLNPKRLIVGTRILVPQTPGDTSVINPIGGPSHAARERSAPAASPAPPTASGETYTVKGGDSLWRIAKASLGDESRWREIFELNKDQLTSPDRLRVGQVLKLPAK